MLTSILRKVETQYCDELLSQNKSNNKKARSTINIIMKRHSPSAAPLSEFNFVNKLYKNKKARANGYNKVFVNIGPKLAT